MPKQGGFQWKQSFYVGSLQSYISRPGGLSHPIRIFHTRCKGLSNSSLHSKRQGDGIFRSWKSRGDESNMFWSYSRYILTRPNSAVLNTSVALRRISLQLVTLQSKLYLISFLIFRTRPTYIISYPLLFAKVSFFSAWFFLSFQLEERYCIFNKYKRLTILLPLKHATPSEIWTSILFNLLRLLMFYSSASHCGRNAIKIILGSLLTTMAKHFHSH